MYLNGRFAFLFCAVVTPVALSLAGCGADPLTRDDFCEKWASAACTSEVVSVCQSSAPQCRAAQAASCEDWLPADFQDVGVDDCLGAVSAAYSDADLNAAELDIVWRLGAPCNNIVMTGEDGETCQRDADCSSSVGLTCVFKDQATGTCERAELVEAGFSCMDANEVCEPGFYCNGENCIAAVGAGESCENDLQCEDGHFCQDELCEAQLPVGADCSTDRDCESEICYAVDDDQRVCVDRIRLSPAEPACDALR